MVNYKEQISTPIISDTLDSIGYEHQMLPVGIKPNFLTAKIFGRARTMKLERITEGTDYRDVYQSLYFVEGMKAGEVLVVANAFQELAFFGELMSTLAQRSGVDGAIVDGCTRDYVETVQMGFPVFSRNSYARDIKKRGIATDFNEPAQVGDVLVKPGDLIFGDHDGVVVIPTVAEQEVLDKCIEVANLEEQIKKDIAAGISVDKLLRKRGEF